MFLAEACMVTDPSNSLIFSCRLTFEPFGAQRAVLTAVDKGLGPDDLLEVSVRGNVLQRPVRSRTAAMHRFD